MEIQIVEIIRSLCYNKAKRTQLMCLSFCLLFLSCVITPKKLQSKNNGKVPIKNENWIKIPIQVNQQSTFATFDTGATKSIINTSLLDSLALTKIPLIKVLVNKKKWMPMYLIKEIEIGGSIFKNLIVVEMDLNHLDTDFIIGMDIIKKFNWEFDFKNNTVETHNQVKEYQGYNHLYYKKKNRPILDLYINGEKNQLLFDTGGAKNNINLQINKVTDSTKVVSQSDVITQYESKVYYEKVDVAFGKDTLRKQVLRYDYTTPSLIGLDFIRQYNEMIILPKQKAILFN